MCIKEEEKEEKRGGGCKKLTWLEVLPLRSERNVLTLRRLMSYIYGAPILDVSSGRAARLLRSWVRIPPGHGYLSVVSVVCCQVEVSATS